MVGLRRPGSDQSWHEWSALPHRAVAGSWPGGSRLCVSAVIALDYYEDCPPEGTVRAGDLGGASGLPPVQPQYAQVSTREYGLRVGFFRLAQALEDAGVRPAVALDAMTAEQYPFLVEYCLEHGYELIAHGIAATRPITSAMSLEDETVYLADSLRRLEYATGQVPSGWFGPSWSESTRTPGLLASFGLDYVCDWPNDEQPHLMGGAAASLVSLPMMMEYDDNYSLIVRNQTVGEYADAIRRGGARLALDAQASPRFLGLSFNAWISGKPWRVRAIAAAVRSVVELDDVASVSPGEVAEWTAAGTTR